jgi:hypothetical protein
VRSFGRLRCLWEDNIKLNIGEMYYEVVIWTEHGQVLHLFFYQLYGV